MKSFLLIFFTLCIVDICNCQVIKLHCFEQSINGGASQKEETETSTEKPDVMPQDNSRFFLFAEIKKGSNPVIKEIWIKGYNYTFKTDTVKKLPFVLNNYHNGKIITSDTLLRKSNKFFLQLINLTLQNSLPEKKTIDDVVINYKIKGRIIVSKLKKIKITTPLFTQ